MEMLGELVVESERSVYQYDKPCQARARSCPGHVSDRGVSGTRPDASSVVTP